METKKMFDLTGKVALITGGNSGIGLGMAEGLAAAGASVCIWGTNEEKNRAAQERLQAFGGKVLALRCDVSDEEAVDRTMAETVEKMGRVDTFFANAGVSGRRGGVKSFMEMPTSEWRRVLNVNLDGAFFSLRAASRHMVDRGGNGSLVLTTSISAVSGTARGEHYAATKGALISITKALAVELARYKIRANAILPGWIDTPMTNQAFSTEMFKSKILTRVPARRWGVREDFAGIAVYLASDASVYHTGDTFIIDGGYLCF